MQVMHMRLLYHYRYGSVLPIRLGVVRGNTLRDALVFGLSRPHECKLHLFDVIYILQKYAPRSAVYVRVRFTSSYPCSYTWAIPA